VPPVVKVFSPPEFRNLLVHDHRHILLRSQIPELHDPSSLARQLSPPARLVRILLDRLVLSPIHHESCGPEPPRPGPPHARTPPVDHHRGPAHQLLRHRSQNLVIHRKAQLPIILLNVESLQQKVGPAARDQEASCKLPRHLFASHFDSTNASSEAQTP